MFFNSCTKLFDTAPPIKHQDELHDFIDGTLRSHPSLTADFNAAVNYLIPVLEEAWNSAHSHSSGRTPHMEVYGEVRSVIHPKAIAPKSLVAIWRLKHPANQEDLMCYAIKHGLFIIYLFHGPHQHDYYVYMPIATSHSGAHLAMLSTLPPTGHTIDQERWTILKDTARLDLEAFFQAKPSPIKQPV